jgi:hypothetical protein
MNVTIPSRIKPDPKEVWHYHRLAYTTCEMIEVASRAILPYLIHNGGRSCFLTENAYFAGRIPHRSKGNETLTYCFLAKLIFLSARLKFLNLRLTVINERRSSCGQYWNRSNFLIRSDEIF